MKSPFLLFLLLLPGVVIGQTLSLDSGETYAVVVGISNYQDEAIPDLQFADRDAAAFARFLQSPAGGSLDEDHLKLLTNEAATTAQFDAALALQPDFPHPYYSMSAVHFYQMRQLDSAEFYAAKAVELAPSWFILYTA